MNDEFTAYLCERAGRFINHVRSITGDPDTRSIVIELRTGVRITVLEPAEDMHLYVPLLDRVMAGAIVIEPVE